MGALDFLFGKRGGYEQVPLPKGGRQYQEGILNGSRGIEQNGAYSSGLDFLLQLLSQNPEMMQAFEQPYMENFQQNVIPGITNQFAGVGTGNGGLNSSGFQNSLAQAGRGLQSDLASMRGQMQMQALPQALAYAQQPETNRMNILNQAPNQSTYRPAQQGFLTSALSNIAGGFAGGLGYGQGYGR